MPSETVWFSAIGAVGWIEGRRGIGESAAVAELASAIEAKLVTARGWDRTWWQFARNGLLQMQASVVFRGADVVHADLERTWPAGADSVSFLNKNPPPQGQVQPKRRGPASKREEMAAALRRLIAAGKRYPSEKSAMRAVLAALGASPGARGYSAATFHRVYRAVVPK